MGEAAVRGPAGHASPTRYLCDTTSPSLWPARGGSPAHCRFSPQRLSLQYLHGAGEAPESLEARRYTLTHCDRTGHLQLSIGAPAWALWAPGLGLRE